MEAKKVGLGIILVILIVYMLSPLDFMPAVEFDDVVAGIIAIVVAFGLGRGED